jgi:hypothetical protein
VDGPRSEGVAQVTVELQAGNLGRGGRLARAGQVAHGRYDEGRERPWSEQGMKVSCTVCEEKPEEGEAQEGNGRGAA